MEINITANTRNELLLRNELEFTLTFDGATPSRMQITGKLGALQNAREDLIVLDSVNMQYGSRTGKGLARIYDTAEARTRTERDFLLSRGQPKAEAEE
ncbi:MAG: 30S ribosomal protein S24e [Methanocalculus sp. MSAO_Arc1]|uniref:30S ribosomal protein S24e n=1 Tax=Methanocalculus TaxID=71151 RepID=UPI000FF7ADDC|nr:MULTISPECIES: 30S ribosomal protein S24e [unclassified Methanocalculus]MCP1662629.1 small subunit ribosomal protein S24e [Methanocalculus sp. AMF5]RQD80337.1 MAG: 30S ribosomal protein S24e [Methanocalculus sp. MSAO_Arc1]